MHTKRFIPYLLSILAALSAFSPAYGALPFFTENQPLPTLAPMLERSMPAVVNISTTKNIEVMDNPLLQDPFFRHFFQIPNQPMRRQQNSLGSGVIIDSKGGYILTNNHVIDKADEIMVTLSDGRQLKAELVGTDPEADVAVIRVPAENLTELPIADSDKLRVGDFVVAIGNPFGLGQTVTSGIISALGRTGLGIEGYENFIQTDASINTGNSGGALVNLKGELIGINTAILAPSGGNVGIGFAIPSNMVMQIKDSLVKHGEVRRGLLGVTTQDINSELAKAFNLSSTRGVVIGQVHAGSPAARAGLEPGDIILSVNGKAIKNSYEVRNIVGLMQIGDKIELDILRGNEHKDITAFIGKPQRITVDGQTLHRGLKGTTLGATSRDQVEGVLLEKVQQGSPAARADLRAGDIIVSANRFRVRSIDELKQVVDPQGPLLLNVQRGGAAFFVILK
jgi:Do/DeqQ family serine protease